LTVVGFSIADGVNTDVGTAGDDGGDDHGQQRVGLPPSAALRLGSGKVEESVITGGQ
jgi:hypothetical protein